MLHIFKSIYYFSFNINSCSEPLYFSLQSETSKSLGISNAILPVTSKLGFTVSIVIYLFPTSINKDGTYFESSGPIYVNEFSIKDWLSLVWFFIVKFIIPYLPLSGVYAK